MTYSIGMIKELTWRKSRLIGMLWELKESAIFATIVTESY
jgi:hypothetical protein